MLTLDRTCVEHWFPWAAGVDVPKIAPDDVAHQVFDAVEAGEIRRVATERPRQRDRRQDSRLSQVGPTDRERRGPGS